MSIHRDGTTVALAAGLPRRLLAVLICQNGGEISAAALVEELWDGAPPASARKALQVYVHRLRGALGELVRIVHGGGGYRLVVDRDAVDSLRFRDLVDQARCAARDARPEQASELYSQALRLWRGEPYADVRVGPLLANGVRNLTDLRLLAREESFAIDLDLGRHADHIAELTALVEIHPFREQLRICLMLALDRCGRRADALQVFRDTRAAFIDQLGIEPSAPLQRLHQAVLQGDAGQWHMSVNGPTRVAPSLSAPTGLRASSAKAPAQLPADTAGFVGRVAPLSQLDVLAQRLDTNPSAGVGIAVITGPAGVGKTTVALHWAHRVADQFPDGQLYVNLRGFDARSNPVPPEDVLRDLLHTFGVPARHVPAGIAAQAALFRSTVAGQRILMVLDNALDSEQVRPLLPGSTGASVLITSRNHLSGLVAVEGAQLVVLDLLADRDARDLLARRLGAPRVAAEPAAVDELVRCCAGLPLALSVVAARAASNPTWPLAIWVDELSDLNARLDALAGDGPATDVRSVFSWSYHKLSSDAARLFRLLACLPGQDFGLDATASVAGVSTDRAKRLLLELSGLHMVIQLGPGRYTLHDLLRAYAAELALASESDTDYRAAMNRILDHYLHTAYAADRLLYPHRHRIELSRPLSEVTTTQLADHDQALAWFGQEHPALVAAVKQAAATGFGMHAWQLAWSAQIFLDRRGYWNEMVALQEIALGATHRLGDESAEAVVRLQLGIANTTIDRFDTAHVHYERMFEILSQPGHDTALLAHGHLNRSITFEWQEKYAQALDHAQRSLALFLALGHRPGQAKSLNAVGWFQILLGHPDQAVGSCRRALAMARVLHDRQGEAFTWDSLGHAHQHLGRYHSAIACYRRSLDLFRILGDRYQLVSVLHRLGDTELAAGDPGAAEHDWQAAIHIAEEVSHLDAAEIRSKLRRLLEQPDP